MREIPLIGGGVTIVDDEDYELLSREKWYPLRSGKTNYAICNAKQKDGTFKTVSLHIFLCGSAAGLEWDHRNGNGLDNRRSNLRQITHQQNTRNSRPRGGTSRFKGVDIKGDANPAKKWRAQIHTSGKKMFLGCHETEEAAARAYDEAARLHFGEYAYLNFPAEVQCGSLDG